MRTDEIVQLTRKKVAELVRSRQTTKMSFWKGHEKRRHVRWPFPGMVELWPVGGDGRQRWMATCYDISDEGLGMITQQPFAPGMKMELSCHLPEATLLGYATIRYCAPIPQGFRVGVEFNFGDENPSEETRNG